MASPKTLAHVEELLKASPISSQCKEAYAEILEWPARQERLEQRREELLLARAEATERYHGLLAHLSEFSSATLARAQAESGFSEIDQELAAISALLPRLSAERARAAEAFERLRTRERRENLARLAGEQKLIIKKALAALRQLTPLLPEVARIAVEAARWSREAKAPRPNHEGHTFPAHPPASLAEFVRYIVAVHGGELD